VTWRIVPKVGLVLIFFGAIGSAQCQTSNHEESTPGLKPGLRGKSIFELKCATCHGLDGLGGEHAPDVIRRPTVRVLSDRALYTLIHDGIPQRGMPGFSDMGEEESHAVITYLRFLQGKAALGPMRGDPFRGRNLFFGKAGCSVCHMIRGRGHLIAGDVIGFARDHESGEIRDAILKPETFASGKQEAATAVARYGRKFSGMIRNEDNASLQLQDGDGRFYLLMKSSLASVQRQTEAPMPVDYGQQLNATELDDLVGYILREARAPDLPSLPSGKGAEPHAQD